MTFFQMLPYAYSIQHFFIFLILFQNIPRGKFFEQFRRICDDILNNTLSHMRQRHLFLFRHIYDKNNKMMHDRL